jgi:hypothetical protein
MTLSTKRPGIEDRLRSVTLLAEAMQETVSPNG